MLLSIIMPIYNSQEHLDESIQSIISQPGCFELILVDDGSTDGSLAICQKYMQRDQRIKVIHTKNYGVSHARNTGIAAATGEYIEFVDSDDMLEAGSIPRLMSNIEQSQPDVLLFSFRTFGNNVSQVMISDCVASQSCTIEKKIHDIVSSGRIVSCWAKVYKRSVIGDVRFREDLSYAEDYYFNLQVFLSVRTLLGVQDPLYCYRVGPPSLSGKYHEDGFSVAGELMNLSETLFQQFAITEKECIRKNYAYNITALLQRLVLQEGISSKQKVCAMRRNCNDIYIACMQECYPGIFSRILKTKNYWLLYWYMLAPKSKKRNR